MAASKGAAFPTRAREWEAAGVRISITPAAEIAADLPRACHIAGRRRKQRRLRRGGGGAGASCSAYGRPAAGRTAGAKGDGRAWAAGVARMPAANRQAAGRQGGRRSALNAQRRAHLNTAGMYPHTFVPARRDCTLPDEPCRLRWHGGQEGLFAISGAVSGDVLKKVLISLAGVTERDWAVTCLASSLPRGCFPRRRKRRARHQAPAAAALPALPRRACGITKLPAAAISACCRPLRTRRALRATALLVPWAARCGRDILPLIRCAVVWRLPRQHGFVFYRRAGRVYIA